MHGVNKKKICFILPSCRFAIFEPPIKLRRVDWSKKWVNFRLIAHGTSKVTYNLVSSNYFMKFRNLIHRGGSTYDGNILPFYLTSTKNNINPFYGFYQFWMYLY